MKIMKKILLFLILILLTGCNPSSEKLTIDYYTYVNKDELDSYELSDDEFNISTFTKTQDIVNKQVDSILDAEILNGTNSNINILYNQFIDISTRNNNGLSTIKYYIDLIDSSNNINEFINNAIVIENDLFIPVFSLMSVMSDFKDTSRNMIYLFPVTFDFGVSSEYYVDDNYLAQKAIVKQYGIKLLKLYGYDSKKAREVSKNIIDYYTDISVNSKSSTYFTDVKNIYNIITKDELKQIYSKLPSSYFNIIPDNFKLSILDEGNYKAINNSLIEENLFVLKESLKLKILESYCSYLSEDYLKIANSFNDEQLGITSTLDVKDIAKSTILNVFQDEVDFIYNSKYLNDDNKKYINSMINDILTYQQKNIKNLDWLSEETKVKAINKIKNIKVNIGLPTNYQKYSNNYNLNVNNTLIENILLIMKSKSDYELQRLLNNEKNLSLSQTTVNAYYNPQDNSINFPVAMLNLVNFDKTYYENLGSIGMIISHEIIHAFDVNGSEFDENGNLFNWWTNEDKTNYKQLQDKVIDYYNKYEVISGNYINGELTLSENIADLGAVSCISGIAKEKNATFQEIRLMFESFATLWAEKSREEYIKMLLLVDTHSPNKYRVNATLASTDLFYEVYNVSKNNPLYITESNRLRIW